MVEKGGESKMAVRIINAIVDQGDGRVHVVHHFYGATETEAREMKEHHLGTCSYFKSAETAGDTAEEIEHGVDWPDVDDFDGED